MKPARLLAALAAATLLAFPATAQERYGSKPPVVLSPDLAAPWVIQLRPTRSITGNSVRSDARKVIFRTTPRVQHPAARAHRAAGAPDTARFRSAPGQAGAAAGHGPGLPASDGGL